MSEEHLPADLLGQGAKVFQRCVDRTWEELDVMEVEFDSTFLVELQKLRVKLSVAGEEDAVVNVEAVTWEGLFNGFCLFWYVARSEQLQMEVTNVNGPTGAVARMELWVADIEIVIEVRRSTFG